MKNKKKIKNDFESFVQDVSLLGDLVGANTSVASFRNCRAWNNCSVYVLYVSKNATKFEAIDAIVKALKNPKKK